MLMGNDLSLAAPAEVARREETGVRRQASQPVPIPGAGADAPLNISRTSILNATFRPHVHVRGKGRAEDRVHTQHGAEAAKADGVGVEVHESAATVKESENRADEGADLAGQ